MRADPKAYEIFTHFKGMKYQVLAVAKHSETGEKYVVYQALYDDYQVYVRPFALFMSEVDHDKYPSVTQKYRFSRSGEETAQIQTAQIQTAQIQTVASLEAGMDTQAIAQAEAARVDHGADKAVTHMEELAQQDKAQDVIDPLVWEFLDADTYEARLNILAALHHRITDEMINTMAVAIDVEVNEGPIEDRYEALKTCLLTRNRYECIRL